MCVAKYGSLRYWELENYIFDINDLLTFANRRIHRENQELIAVKVLSHITQFCLL